MPEDPYYEEMPQIVIDEIEKNNLSAFVPSYKGIPLTTDPAEYMDIAELEIDDTDDIEISDDLRDEELITEILRIINIPKDVLSIDDYDSIRFLLLQLKLAIIGTAYPTLEFHHTVYYSGLAINIPDFSEIDIIQTQQLWINNPNEWYYQKVKIRLAMPYNVLMENIWGFLNAVPFIGYIMGIGINQYRKYYTDEEFPIWEYFPFLNTVPNKLIYHNWEKVKNTLLRFRKILDGTLQVNALEGTTEPNIPIITEEMYDDYVTDIPEDDFEEDISYERDDYVDPSIEIRPDEVLDEGIIRLDDGRLYDTINGVFL